jgi:hypothetical protein
LNTGRTPLKLNDQNLEDDATITREDLNNWKNFQTYYRKNTCVKNLPSCRFPQTITYPGTEGFAFTIQDRVIKTRKRREALLTKECDQQMQKIR